MNDLPRDLIDTGHAARIARVHVSSVFRWIMSGRLRGWKRKGHAGRPRYFVSRAAVEALWEPVEGTGPRPEKVVPPPLDGRRERERRQAAVDAELKRFGIV